MPIDFVIKVFFFLKLAWAEVEEKSEGGLHFQTSQLDWVYRVSKLFF